jgi:hypothetical protein
MKAAHLAAGLGSLALAAACGGGGSDIPAECNPLGEAHCAMPWPSSAYLEADATTPTGVRVALPVEAMPINGDGIAIDPTPFNRHDGFSPSGAIIAAFPGGVADQGLPGAEDPAASQSADSAILLIDMETGERPLLFAEIDHGARPEDATLLIRPLERLRPGARYAVAIRDSLRGPGGDPLPRSPGFQALLDGGSIDHPRFAAVAAGAADVFAAVEAAGVGRDELVLAWDFVTASDESLTRDLLTMRDAALPAIGEAGANLGFEMTSVGGNPALTHSLFLGTHDSPNFMTDGESDTSILLRGGDDLPAQGGTYDANFAVVIPACVETEPLPIPIVVFGHGLFGSAAGYADDNFLQEIANDKCFAVVAGDWIGLTERQITSAALSANDLNRSHALVEKLAQAVINFIALENLARGPLAAAPELQIEGQPILDTDQVWYLGGSLGGIMGGTFMAYDPHIELGALGVPGGSWSLLIERSFAWTPLQVAAQSSYRNQLDYQLLVALFAFSLERWDPITVARRVLDDPLPGTPPKQLLLYEGVNDSLVTNLATEMLARTLGLPVTGPSVKVPAGMTEAGGPAPSGFSIYDENVPVATEVNVPPNDDNGTHGGVNERAAVLDQVEHFFRNAEVIHTCGADDPAPCDCSTGACD